MSACQGGLSPDPSPETDEESLETDEESLETDGESPETDGEMMECVFCGISAKTIPASIVAESEEWLAFRDLDPQAPVHLLVIPREHISSLDDLSSGEVGGRLLLACAEVARAEGLEKGYRVVTNIGGDGGQSVPHLHFHVLGLRRMGWPPG